MSTKFHINTWCTPVQTNYRVQLKTYLSTESNNSKKIKVPNKKTVWLLTVWLAPHTTSRTTTLGTGITWPSLVFSMKMATRRGISSQSNSIRWARAMNFPSELCPVGSKINKNSHSKILTKTIRANSPLNIIIDYRAGHTLDTQKSKYCPYSPPPYWTQHHMPL